MQWLPTRSSWRNIRPGTGPAPPQGRGLPRDSSGRPWIPAALIATDSKDGRTIGSSRFHGYNREKSEIEIGWTLLAKSHWWAYNMNMKQFDATARLPICEKRDSPDWSAEFALAKGRGKDRCSSGRIKTRSGHPGVSDHRQRSIRTPLVAVTGVKKPFPSAVRWLLIYSMSAAPILAQTVTPPIRK